MKFRGLVLFGLWSLCGVLNLPAAETLSEASNVPVKNISSQCIIEPLEPLPAPVQTTNVVPLSPAEQLGKDIFFDHTLSDPEGYACATCHIPQSGFTGPSSQLNVIAGPAPGVIPGRFGRRKPQSISYAAFSPAGPYLNGGEGGTYLGGNFWDGRTPDTATQARLPFLDQNEMANAPVGPFAPHAGGYSPLVVEKLKTRPYTGLFESVFGSGVFTNHTQGEVYELMTAAIAAYEASGEVNQFSSKYDASTNGTPAINLYQLTPSEENGRQLFFGDAQCSLCHSSAPLDPVSLVTEGKETFTMYCYANIGLPANPGNPFYINTNCDSNPEGCNPLGTDYVDYGLGANPNPAPDGTVFYTNAPGDIPQFRGLFKAPSLRNVDMRPSPGFVKSFMHNGVFKSLEEVVHFYNKRNIATNAFGEEVPFDLAVGPPDGFTPIFPPPEVIYNVQNVAGLTPEEAAILSSPPDGDDNFTFEINGQIGNLELTAQEEADLVNFLKTLTDGYTRPNPANPAALAASLTALSPQPASGSFVLQFTGQFGQFYVIQTSTNLTDWFPISTNILDSSFTSLTNQLVLGAPQQFWRAITVP